jgi:hypothetical protein
MKGIIFNTKKEAQDWNREQSHYPNSNTTSYRWSMKPLTQTTNLTKVQYAEMMNIPKQIESDEEGTLIDNPQYTELKSSYTVPKYAVIVNDDCDIHETETDEEGNEVPTGVVTVPDEVVDVSSLIPVYTEE